MAHEFTHEADARRYVMRVNGQLASTVEYSILGDAVSLTRAFTTPSMRGKGYAAEIVRYAVDDIEAGANRRIVPMCWYVSQWFDEHPDRAHLLNARPVA
ncbi:GNAT family N-acetyltransferase [Rathayibacter sp. YIM 133350]|uniref:GNAT family N-acetyltransferase n=1 Tax=Rathayibacter sp. YIM 133350 TaxID=3131992 RepID=UPI00307E2F88